MTNSLIGRKLQMGDPYSRIIFMHLVLIFGGGVGNILDFTLYFI